MAKRSRNHSRRSQQDQPHATFPLRSQVLQTTTPHRERLLPSQGLPPHRHTLRQARQKLPRRSLPRRCYRLVDFMSLDPSYATEQLAPSHLHPLLHSKVERRRGGLGSRVDPNAADREFTAYSVCISGNSGPMSCGGEREGRKYNDAQCTFHFQPTGTRVPTL